MGKTRSLLVEIENIIQVHDIEKHFLIKKYCENPHLEKFYRHQIDAFDQKYEKKFRDMIDEHISYLEEKDPYGRQPLWGAEAKKQLFLKMQQALNAEHYQGEMYIRKLSKFTAQLLKNEIIDKPRWPGLQLDNVFHFFKSIFSKSNYLDHLKPKKEEHKSSSYKPKS